MTEAKKKQVSPTARTLAELRKRGHPAQVVERWNQYARVRVDLFGVIDLIYLGDVITGVQATSATNHAARVSKVLEEPRALAWIRAGGRIEVWSWAKQGAAGTRKLWQLRVEVVTADRFALVPQEAAA